MQSRNTARVKTYGDIIREYERYPESKCAESTGKPCTKQTVGLLQRRHVHIDGFRFIGKESNRLEDVASGLIHDPQSVYTEYCDRRRDVWVTKTLQALKAMPTPQLQKQSGLSRAALQAIRAGRRPHPKNDKRRDDWVTKILPVLKSMPVSLLEAQSGLSRAALQAIRAGRRPHQRNQQVLAALVGKAPH